MVFRLSSYTIGIFWLFAVLSIAVEKSSASSNLDIKDSQLACPTIRVSCPAEIKDDEPITFTASVTGGNPNVVPVYDWTVSTGRIIEGQGSSSIKVDIRGLGGHDFTGTVSIFGFESACAMTASCSFIQESLPACRLFDSYGSRPARIEAARLNAFAVQLREQPGTQGFVLAYGGRRGYAREAQKLATDSQEYLVRTLGIEPGRIVAVDGGVKENLIVDLWIVPTGSVRPVPDPTVNPTEVTIIKPAKRKSSRQ